MPAEKQWTYVFVRTDLPLPQIAVQAAHATLEAPQAFTSLILISIKNKYQLEKALTHVKSLGLATYEFFEPSWDYGFTSFAVEPVTDKTPFRRYQLWKG